jgi:hypothetical protein
MSKHQPYHLNLNMSEQQYQNICELADICKRRKLVEQAHLNSANQTGAIHKAVAEYLKQLKHEQGS